VGARVDLSEFLSAFLAEAEEQLSLANARILLIEASQRKGERNPRAVRDLFRALHTLKGLSSMVGIDPIVAIAHRMEAVLRAADRADGALPPSAIDPLLAGLRAIDVRVRALSAEKAVAPPPGALLASLEAIAAGDAGQAASGKRTVDLDAALVGKLAAFEHEQLSKGLEEGNRVLQIEYVPSAERAATGQSINSVRERLGTIAEIVKVVPVTRPSGPGGGGGLAFLLLVITTSSDEDVCATAGVDPSAVRSVASRESEPAGAVVPAPLQPDDAELLEEQPERRNVLRVDVSRVDDAMEKLSTLIVSRSRLARLVSTLDPASFQTRELKQIGTDIARQLRELRASILNVRMVRVGEVLERIPLVVRGLRRVTGKLVRLDMAPGDAELDKAVAERIFPAVLHLVRNAVDHGIESPDERRAAGKPEEGVIRITASARSNTKLELVISDDGRGVEPSRVAGRAGTEVPTTDAALLDLLCRPGLSTRDEVTTTSGRGMGMDIVRRVVVDELGGELVLSTQVGVGTTFTLLVPLTISIIDAFVTECAGQRYVVPVAAVEEILEVGREQIVSAPVTTREGTAHLGMFERRGEAVPLVDIAALFLLTAAAEPSRRAFVVRRNGQPVAFVCDRVTGQQEVVVRPLVDPLVNVSGVSGATDLGDGRPTLVLDLVALAGSRVTNMLRSSTKTLALAGGSKEIQRS
jgi:two-component system chemotaxis sensor kinase CheA